ERKSIVEHDTCARLHLVFDRKAHLVRYNDLCLDPAPTFGEDLRGYPGGHHKVRSRVSIGIQASDCLFHITGPPTGAGPRYEKKVGFFWSLNCCSDLTPRLFQRGEPRSN